MPDVSVVIPCRNEETYIEACLASVAAGDFPKTRLEVLVVDGLSDDRTRAIVARVASTDRTIRLIDNPGRTAPTAMNVGIRSARGAVIVRMDAHCLYPAHYISRLVEQLESTGADNVGGLWRTRPANATPKARAIALGMSHPFGVGNSYFRIGVTEPRWVDTVPFGCYRRDVFERVGLFDEDLVRNQDDELNARLIQHGGRILLVPDVVCDYFARDSIGKLWKMYYQYGYFKPLVARRRRQITTVRQLVPALFVAGAGAGGVLAPVVPTLRIPVAILIATYSAATIAAASRAGWRLGTGVIAWLAVVFPVLHIAYGVGFLKGLLDFVVRRRRPDTRILGLPPSR